MSALSRTRARELLVGVIRPALGMIDLGGRGAEELMLGTAIQESQLVYRMRQGGGPARGLWQMEPETLTDCFINYLNSRSRRGLRTSVLNLLPLDMRIGRTAQYPSEALVRALASCDRFACGMARVQYLRASAPLPKEGAIVEQADYWKRNYNTYKGDGKVEDYLSNWAKFTDIKTFSE